MCVVGNAMYNLHRPFHLNSLSTIVFFVTEFDRIELGQDRKGMKNFKT